MKRSGYTFRFKPNKMDAHYWGCASFLYIYLYLLFIYEQKFILCNLLFLNTLKISLNKSLVCLWSGDPDRNT